MTDPARTLKLTETGARRAPAWNPGEWLAGLRERGLLEALSPAECKLIMVYLSRAHRDGIAYPGIESLAGDTGYGERACLNARKSLIERGILTPASPPRDRRTRALCLALTLPEPVEPTTGSTQQTPAEAPSCSGEDACTLNTHSPDPCTHVHPDPERAFTRKAKGKGKKKGSSAHGEGATEQSGGRSELFEGKPRDAAAAEVLVHEAGMAKKPANGLVNQYRPTAEQIRNILANAAARNRAHQRGEADRPVNNLPGFVKAAVQRGEYQLDPRVAEERRRAEREQQRAERAAQAEQEQKQREAAERAKRERRAKAERAYEQLTDDQRQAYCDRILADLPVAAAQRLHVDHPRVMQWTIDMIAEALD